MTHFMVRWSHGGKTIYVQYRTHEWTRLQITWFYQWRWSLYLPNLLKFNVYFNFNSNWKLISVVMYLVHAASYWIQANWWTFTVKDADCLHKTQSNYAIICRTKTHLMYIILLFLAVELKSLAVFRLIRRSYCTLLSWLERTWRRGELEERQQYTSCELSVTIEMITH